LFVLRIFLLAFHVVFERFILGVQQDTVVGVRNLEWQSLCTQADNLERLNPEFPIGDGACVYFARGEFPRDVDYRFFRDGGNELDEFLCHIRGLFGIHKSTSLQGM